MIRVYDFKCTQGHVFEEFVQAQDRKATCHCGSTAKRIVSPVRCALDPLSGDFASATKQWAKHREEEAKKHTPSDAW